MANLETVLNGRKVKIPVIEVTMVKGEYYIVCAKQKCKDQLNHDGVKYCKYPECIYKK